MDSPPSIDPRIYETEYESLRSHMAFTEATDHRGVGLTLLLREGLPNWINAVTEYATARLSARIAVTEPTSSHIIILPATVSTGTYKGVHYDYPCPVC